MPPPYQRNPVRSARSDFLGESPPRYYFPEPGKTSAFGPHFSGRQLSNLEFETDEFLTKKDDMLTRRRENAFRHMQNESDARVMPFEEEKKVAGAQYETERDKSMGRRLPSEEEEAIERNKLGAGASRVGQQMLPGDEEVASQVQERKLERASRIEDIMSNDPAERQLSQWTKDPNDLYNYRSILNRTDPKLPKAQREREAFRRSMRLVKDRDYIQGLYQAERDGDLGPGEIEKLLDVDMDDDGNFYGQYIKPDKTVRARVERILAANALKKEAFTREKEERQASRLDIESRSRAFQRILDAAENTLKEALPGTPEHTAAMQKKQQYLDRLERLYGEDNAPAPAGRVAPQAGKAPVKADVDQIDAAFFGSKAK